MEEYDPRPRIGVLIFTSGWFREIGLQVENDKTTEKVNRIGEELCDRIEEFARPVYTGVIFSEEEAGQAGKVIAKADVDGIILAPIMWCEDQIVRKCMERLPDVPIFLWAFSPVSSMPDFLDFQTMLQRSGTVCALQLSGMLKREGYIFYPIAGSGDDSLVWEKIRKITEILQIKRSMKSLKVGVLPFPCSYMSTTYVDEFGLRTRYGIELKYLGLSRVAKVSNEIDAEKIELFRRKYIHNSMEIAVDENNLVQGIRYALALESLIEEEGIGVLAMNDVIEEMHQTFGLRPCLSNPGITGVGAVICMEADIAAGVAMYILGMITGEPPFYTEVFSVDYLHNTLLLGHAGYHDAANADPNYPVRIISDIEYKNSDPYTGCATYFKYREGPVTIVNSVWDGDQLKWFAFEGHSLGGPCVLEGNCHLLCKAKPKVDELLSAALQDGISQHWIVIPNHILEDLSLVCNILGIKFSAV